MPRPVESTIRADGRRVAQIHSVEPRPAELTVDHKDGNPRNNRASNLVPACRTCNMQRAQVGNPQAFGQWTLKRLFAQVGATIRRVQTRVIQGLLERTDIPPRAGEGSKIARTLTADATSDRLRAPPPIRRPRKRQIFSTPPPTGQRSDAKPATNVNRRTNPERRRRFRTHAFTGVQRPRTDSEPAGSLSFHGQMPTRAAIRRRRKNFNKRISATSKAARPPVPIPIAWTRRKPARADAHPGARAGWQA